jgi:hypothetical protein
MNYLCENNHYQKMKKKNIVFWGVLHDLTAKGGATLQLSWTTYYILAQHIF